MKIAILTACLVVAAGTAFMLFTREPSARQNLEQYIADNQPAQEYTDQNLATSTGRFLPYQQSSLNNYPGSKLVLFFNADWCPTCQVAKKAFSEQANNLPENLIIFDVDYDEHQDLRRQYGVTTQHTFVQVDSMGGELKQWTGSYIPAQLADLVI